MSKSIIGVIGAGTMGRGIAQVAAQNGHQVVLQDINEGILEGARSFLIKIMDRLKDKGKIDESHKNETLERIRYTTEIRDLAGCSFVIEAAVEKIEIKRSIFQELESLVANDAIIASNTSSLSIASIAAACRDSHRVIGVHFFNPAPLMKLVEIIPAVQTSSDIYIQAQALINSWGKTTVRAKDTPGFIVNRVARPFYGEALRILEEGIADVPTIDWAMTHIGGFKMGPFTLMDYIGNDVNYTVTQTVFEAFYYDPRYKPSFTQKRLSEAGFLGRKTGRGFYEYGENAPPVSPHTDEELGSKIVNRIVTMLINEAADAAFLNIASEQDIDLAMTLGVNYPKGLLSWAQEIGYEVCVQRMDALHEFYKEDRYRCSPYLRQKAR